MSLCNRTSRCFFWLVLACAALVPGSASAAGLANSPWPMFQHDPQHTGRSPHAAGSRLALEWRAPVHGFPGGPAIAADGTIYVPTGDTLYDTDAGSLYAINPDGSRRWRFQFPLLGVCRQVAAFATPAIADDGTIYVHTQAGYTPSGLSCTAGDSYLFAINPNGTERWHFAFNGGAAVFHESVLSSPAIGGDGTIDVASADTGIYAIHPNGTLYWADSPAGASILASPALGPDGSVYVSVADLHAYDADGTPQWTADVGDGVPNESSPSVAAGGTVYGCFLSPWACHAVSSAGSDLWSIPFDAGPATPAIASGGTIYFATGRGTDGKLAAINPATHAELWRADFSDRPIHTPVIGSDGRLYTRVEIGFGAEGPADILVTLNSNGTESDRVEVPFTAEDLGDVSSAIGSDGTLYAPEPSVPTSGYNPDDQHLAAFVQGARLTASVSSGEGEITAPGISCSRYLGDCSENYVQGDSVTLHAQPSGSSSSVFNGWGGACSGTGDCMVTMDSDKSVTASFAWPTTTPTPPPAATAPATTQGGEGSKKKKKKCSQKSKKARKKCKKKAMKEA